MTDPLTAVGNSTMERLDLMQHGGDVNSGFLMNSPWPLTIIVTGYLCFVLKIGPDFMKNRQPLNIKSIILIYNFSQIIYNGYLVSLMFTTSGSGSYIWMHGCHPLVGDLNPYTDIINAGSWHYYVLKLLDLLDTVFFVLRKKNSHVTFLHVYHHVTMVITCWLQQNYIKGQHVVLVGWVNAVVHTVLYSYYFLSVLQPSKFVSWKKHITRLQIVQFILVIVYALVLFIKRCSIDKMLNYLIIAQGIVNLLLFMNFYVKAYMQSEKNRKSCPVIDSNDDIRPVIDKKSR